MARMVLFRKSFNRITPGDLAEAQVRERGDIWTNKAYTEMPIVIHPNDEYLRVFPDGPFSQAWQGVQKDNPIVDLGTNYMGIPNPYYNAEMGLPTIQYDNPAAMSVGQGPVLVDDYEQSVIAGPVQTQPGLLRTILNRLQGS
jgi:hypothetical protein